VRQDRIDDIRITESISDPSDLQIVLALIDAQRIVHGQHEFQIDAPPFLSRGGTAEDDNGGGETKRYPIAESFPRNT
jgi:hypothetical protein